MFWSGNYIVVRELNSLLKEQNVTLSQVLETDDILQECKADNKALIQFLTKPEILAELITLITEEPPQNVELASQYRHASIASEVLTSHLSMLSDRLSYDTVQMNRLCNFINKEPPLNPLLASYFSKTVEMLLERSPKQDWYLYHIVCLRVLDFFKSRRDFLPNLLRHMATSAIADVFKYFIRLDDLFNKIVMEWLEEHQFLDSMIQIICGTYVPEEIRPVPLTAGLPDPADGADKSEHEQTEKTEANHVGDDVNHQEAPKHPEEKPLSEQEVKHKAEKARRIKAVAAYNAASLLCDILLTGCAGEGAYARSRTSCSLLTWLSSSHGVTALLQALCGAPHGPRLPRAPHAPCPPQAPCPPREVAAEHVARVLLTAAQQRAVLGDGQARAETELSAAPHLPLLHRLLLPTRPQLANPNTPQKTDSPQSELRKPAAHVPSDPKSETNPAETEAKLPESNTDDCNPVTKEIKTETSLEVPEADPKIEKEELESQQPIESQQTESSQSENKIEEKSPVDVRPPLETVAWDMSGEPVGADRVQIAMLLAHLAMSEVEEVATTMITLGTPGVLVDMFFQHRHNNFLHAAVYSYIKKALSNNVYAKAYADNLFLECDLLNRLMDAFEDNESGKMVPRAGYMGYVILLLLLITRSIDQPVTSQLTSQLPTQLQQRLSRLHPQLELVQQQYDTPLGGHFPTENSYEVENMAGPIDDNYTYNDINDLNDMPTVDDIAVDSSCSDDKMMDFMNLADKRCDDNMWSDVPEDVRIAPLDEISPWESATEESTAGEGWASFSAEFPPLPGVIDPAVNDPAATEFSASTSQYPLEEFDPRRKEEFSPMWGYQDAQTEPESTSLDTNLQQLSLESDSNKPLDDSSTAELANNLLTAMSSMTPEVIANIVNANMTPLMPDKPEPSDR